MCQCRLGTRPVFPVVHQERDYIMLALNKNDILQWADSVRSQYTDACNLFPHNASRCLLPPRSLSVLKVLVVGSQEGCTVPLSLFMKTSDFSSRTVWLPLALASGSVTVNRCKCMSSALSSLLQSAGKNRSP